MAPAPDAKGMGLLLGNSICFDDLWEFPVDDFLVLARPDVSGLYLLSPSARLIWDLFRTGLQFAEVVREFASAYDIAGELAQQDVSRTLDEWRSGLLAHRCLSSTWSTAPAEASSSSGAAFFRQDYLIQGKNVRVILETSELVDEIAPRFESLPHAPSAPDFTFRVVQEPDGFRILCDGYCVGSEAGVTAARGVLLQEIVRSCRARDCLAVFHAGACGSSTKCVLFPAGTQSGKTTLAAVLMNMGLTFCGDDSVLLERDTLSVPIMPFSLMIREGSWDILYPRFPELRDAPIVSRYGQAVRFLSPAGMKQDGYSEEVGALVFVRYNAGAANEISTLDPLQTLLRLQESGFWVAHDKASIGAFLSWIKSTASFTLSYSDVDQAASIIRRLIG
jgi:hypothetical protein